MGMEKVILSGLTKGAKYIGHTRPPFIAPELPKVINPNELRLCPDFKSAIGDVASISHIKPVKILSSSEREVAENLFRERLLKDDFTLDDVCMIDIPNDKFSNVLSLQDFYSYLKNDLNMGKDELYNIMSSRCVSEYLEFFHKDISTMNLLEKRQLVSKLIKVKAHNNIEGENAIKLFPAIPRNESEYVNTIDNLMRDLTIYIEKLPSKQSEAFKTNIYKLINSISSSSTKDIASSNVYNDISSTINRAYKLMNRDKPSFENLKNIECLVKDCEFQSLNKQDKFLVVLTAFLEKKPSKNADISEIAYEAMRFAEHLNLDMTSCEKIFNLVKNVDAPERFMSVSKFNEQFDNARVNMLHQIGFDLKESNLLQLAKILYKQRYPSGFTRMFDSKLERVVETLKYSPSMPQTSIEEINKCAHVRAIEKNGKKYLLPVANASDVNGLCGYCHTTDAGMNSSRSNFKPNAINFQYFANPMSDEIICTNYLANGKFYPTGYQGFMLSVSPNKQLLLYKDDIWSYVPNLEEFLKQCHLNTLEEPTRNYVQESLCSILSITKSEYISRMENLKEKLSNTTWNIENIEKFDAEFAKAYKKLFSYNEYEKGLIIPDICNEGLVKNPKIIAIYSKNLSTLPIEYLEEAEKRGYTIIDLSQ